MALQQIGGLGRWIVLLLLGHWLASAAHAETFAVLVGVSRYARQPDLAELRGVGNDTLLMQAALVRLGLSEERITVLSDDPRLSALSPTRDRIVRVLEEGAARAKSGDWLVLYFSGHGTRVPMRSTTDTVDSPAHPEPDGLDEVFLPADAGRWNPRTRSLENGLYDNDLALLIRAWTQKGASVWAIFDTCSAGDMAKTHALLGAPPTFKRSVAPASLEVSASDLVRPSSKRLSTGSLRLKGPETSQEIYFYATQPEEVALEEKLRPPISWPEWLDGGRQNPRYFGFFTHALVSALENQPKTFQELAERTMRFHATKPLATPVFEGVLQRGFDLFVRPAEKKPNKHRPFLPTGPSRDGGNRWSR
ncbi:caspase family protein [Aquabacterium lacunae]|uniref:caspase family protein n=1 Tax=Aquabacterium lacunae TaxID=2528630 RepID=UPI0013EF26B0|nr:caspase family protein [Aquabacterium lacunae]